MPSQPEPRYVVVLRLIGAFGLLIGCIFTALAWTVWPSAKLIAIIGVGVFPATALISACISIVKREQTPNDPTLG
jgi:hypothetical protein